VQLEQQNMCVCTAAKNETADFMAAARIPTKLVGI